MSAVAQHQPAPLCSLPANLQWLAQHPQFIVCKFVPDAKRPGKTNKLPIKAATLKLCDAHDATNWLTCEAAIATANALNASPLPVGVLGYGIGFVLTPELGAWCLDIDGALGADGQWLAVVRGLFGLPGVAWEYSHSRTGLHGWGRCSVPLPAHETRTDDAALAAYLEFYSRKRFIALGTAASGEMVLSPSLPAELLRLFPVLSTEDATALDTGLADAPRSMWHGPTDDEALITIALKSKSALATMFPATAKATFKQLWLGEADKLAKHFPAADGYDESRADLALACHLAFWTGAHGTRMAGLLRRSGLNRPKYERSDYIHRTVNKACAWAKNFYNDGKGVVAGAPIPEGAARTGISLDDFYAYLPQKSYIFVPNRELWIASGVDEAAPPPGTSQKPSEWLAKARPVHQMTWAPGEPLVIENRLVAGGGWIHKDGANTFNLYKPPTIVLGDAAQATPWLDLLWFVYPKDAAHIIRWFAHRRQHPGVKINHALVFGGSPSIGKDTICEPLKQAIGPWNMKEIAPKDLLGEFSPHLKAVVLRVSEARDSGDMSRFALYEHCKTLLAAPPDVLRCNEKNLREHDVFNVLGAIFTTNHKDGLYLPDDDRRHYVCWSEREAHEFTEGYWPAMYRWYEGGGYAHVAAYLDRVDLSAFDPKATPEKTPAFWMMVDAGRAPEEGELADALDKLGNPLATAVSRAMAVSPPEFMKWLSDSRNRKQLRHRFESLGYTAVRNGADKHDGQWRLDGKRQTIYVRKELTEAQRQAEAAKLCQSPPLTPQEQWALRGIPTPSGSVQ